MSVDDFGDEDDELVPLWETHRSARPHLPEEPPEKPLAESVWVKQCDLNPWLEDDETLLPIDQRVDGDLWLDRRPPPREFLLTTSQGAGFMPAGRVCLLAAAGGTGKSFAVLQLALSVAVASERQAKWFGTYNIERSGRVLLAMGEEDLGEIERRLFYVAEAMRLTAAEKAVVRSKIVPIGMAGRADIALTRDMAPGERGEVETQFSRRLRARLADYDTWSLVVLDPLARFAAGDSESNNNAATKLISTIERYTKLAGNPTVLAVHHTRKAQMGQGASKGADDIRGASAFKDGARWLMVLEEMERFPSCPRFVRARVAKSNYAAIPEPTVLLIDQQLSGALRQPKPHEWEMYVQAEEEAAEAKKRRR